MRRAVYLDLSIPLFEKESDLKLFSDSLKDLARFISKTSNIKFYVSLTIEFMTTFKKEASPLISSITELQKEGRVEFVVKDSFDINSLILPRNISEFSLILNEYLIGYHFGDKRNFEGDPSIMVRDLVSIFPYKGAVSKKSDLDFLESELGYKNFLLSKEYLPESYLHNSNFFIQVDFEFSKLFTTFVSKESLESYLLGSISSNYMLYYVNPYNIFRDNSDTFTLNFSNLFHLLDLSTSLEFKFFSESFDMPIYRDIKLIESLISENDLLKRQKDLARFVKIELPSSLDLSIYEEYRVSPLWESTGNALIDEYLKTSFLMLTLLSSSIESKINLLNKPLINYLSAILDELSKYSKSNLEFNEALLEYRSYINQK